MRNRKRFKMAALLLSLLMGVGIFCACGAKSDMNETPQESLPSAGSDMAGNLGQDSEQAGEVADVYQTKIIRTADLRAETTDFDGAVKEIESAVSRLGGYVENSQISGRNGESQKKGYNTACASFSLRIPAEHLDEFLTTAGEMLHITSSNATAEDISSTYYDMAARMSVLETERQVLEKMLERSGSVSDMIQLEERLYDVIYEIESYKTMLAVYDQKVAYATVTLSLYEVKDLTVVSETFGERLRTAVTESWDHMVEFSKDTVINVIYALPFLLLFALIFAVISVIVVTVVRKKKNHAKHSKEQGNTEG